MKHFELEVKVVKIYSLARQPIWINDNNIIFND